MRCNNCGTEYNGNFCPACGAQAQQSVQQPQSPKKKGLKTWQIVLIVVGCVIGAPVLLVSIIAGVIATQTVIDSSNEYDAVVGQMSSVVSYELSPSESSTPSQAIAKNVLTFGDTVVFDDLEITLSNNITWTKLDNQFSDFDGADVIKIPVTIKNVGDETNGLNMFYCSFYGPDGNKLDIMHMYFSDDNDVLTAGDMRPGATQQKYFHVLYNGDGDYYLELSQGFGKKVEIKLPIEK